MLVKKDLLTVAGLALLYKHFKRKPVVTIKLRYHQRMQNTKSKIRTDAVRNLLDTLRSHFQAVKCEALRTIILSPHESSNHRLQRHLSEKSVVPQPGFPLKSMGTFKIPGNSNSRGIRQGPGMYTFSETPWPICQLSHGWESLD